MIVDNLPRYSEEEIKEIEKIDAENASTEEVMQVNDRTKELFAEVLDLLLGKDMAVRLDVRGQRHVQILRFGA